MAEAHKLDRCKCKITGPLDLESGKRPVAIWCWEHEAWEDWTLGEAFRGESWGGKSGNRYVMKKGEPR